MIKSSFWRFLKRFVVLCFMALCGAPGIADNITTSPANCNSATLNTATGPATLNADWEANNINIAWYSDGTQITNDANAATQCTYDQTFSLPTPPTKTGYNFAGWKATPVPSIYTEVQYIEFDGARYINTGIVLKDTANIEQTFWVQIDSSALNNFQTLFGFMASGSTPRYGVNVYQKKWMLGINTTASSASTVTSSVYELTYATIGTTQSLKNSDSTLVSANVAANALNSNTLAGYFGARNNNGSAVNYVSGKMGRSYLKQNGVMLYNYIPVRRNSDDVAGMWDTVSGSFLTGTGSGTFTAGPAVSQ